MAAVVGKPDASIDPSSLREHLSASLSSYKIPTRVLIVDSIPRNAIGKALRREMPQQLASQLAPESRGPSTPMEQVLLAIWRKVLRRDDIGVTDNVFQFGADPLRAEMASGLIDRGDQRADEHQSPLLQTDGARAGGVLRGSARTTMSHYSLDGRLPQSMAEDVWLAPTAQVIGDVVLGREASIWFSAIVRGDNEPIVIGDRTNVQDGCVLHSDPGAPLHIGNDATIGHRAMLHGCRIGDTCLIGIGAVILNRASIGEGQLLVQARW